MRNLWVWALGLGLVVAVFVSPVEGAGKRWDAFAPAIAHEKFDTNFCPTTRCFWKNIVVFKPPPNENVFLPALSSLGVGYRNPNNAVGILFGSDVRFFAHSADGLVGVVEIVWNAPVKGLLVRIRAAAASGGGAGPNRRGRCPAVRLGAGGLGLGASAALLRRRLGRAGLLAGFLIRVHAKRLQAGIGDDERRARGPSLVSRQWAASTAAGRSATKPFLSRLFSTVVAPPPCTLSDLGDGRTAPS